MLLLHWVEECPGAVTTLLNNPPFVPYLLELVEHRGNSVKLLFLFASSSVNLQFDNHESNPIVKLSSYVVLESPQ